MTEADHYKWQKQKVLIAVAVLAAVSSGLEMLLSRWDLAVGLIIIFTAVGFVVGVLSWIKIDSDERGTQVSGQMRLFIIVLALVALIYYLFRSRGFVQGLKSSGWALLYSAGVYVVEVIIASTVMFAMLAVTGGGVLRSFQDGNDALAAKKYDVAIARYDDGIRADPDDLSTAPSLHLNRAMALLQRAVDTYNEAIKGDRNARPEGLKSCKKDLADAASDLIASWKILERAQASDIYDREAHEALKMRILQDAKYTFQLAVKSEQVDQPVIDACILLIPKYIAVEQDESKRSEAKLILGDLYRVSGDSEHAVAAYIKVLEKAPDNTDALAGAGFCLVNLSYQNNDNALLLEGKDHLESFLSLAPQDHKLRSDAETLLRSLNTDQAKKVGRK